ncbi:hypothetical protein [Shinella zoogloeoides]|uniref:hypothetical protein n=1 Tax=Shinella zoogloeoides TaxID=352475 RepID=UPI00273D5E13|nr:hypothetical protein [Shinella zoogloeoides]WLR90995.1 hypothetical protein Q9316_00170 [Shinella zoogloeoides]
MKRLKLSGSRWAGYTGLIGTVDFKDGISVDPVPQRIADRLSAAMPMTEIDDEGNEIGVAGVVARLLKDSAARAAPVTPSLVRQTEAEKKAEGLRDKLKAAKSPTDSFYAVEQLQAIADEKGIKGLRLVAEPWGVKGKAIPALIAAIMEAQNKFLEKKNYVVNVLAETAQEPEIVEETGKVRPEDIQTEKLSTISSAAITGDMSAAISTTALEPLDAGETLLGSSVLASSYEIDGKTVTLGELVGVAHQLSGATAAEWNALPDADREDLIRAELDRRLPKD